MEDGISRSLLGRLLPLLAVALIIAVVIGKFVWPTDESRIKRTIDSLRRCVERNDLDGLMELLSADYYDGELGKGEFRETVKPLVDATGPLSVRIYQLRVDVEEDDALARFSAAGRSKESGYAYYAGGRSTWRVALRREQEGWKITAINPDKIAGKQVSNLKHVHP